MKSKFGLMLLSLAVATLLGAGQSTGLAQSAAASPANLAQSVPPPNGYPESEVYPEVPVGATTLAAPISNARRFLLDAGEIIAD